MDKWDQAVKDIMEVENLVSFAYLIASLPAYTRLGDSKMKVDYEKLEAKWKDMVMKRCEVGVLVKIAEVVASLYEEDEGSVKEFSWLGKWLLEAVLVRKDVQKDDLAVINIHAILCDCITKNDERAKMLENCVDSFSPAHWSTEMIARFVLSWVGGPRKYSEDDDMCIE